MIRLSRTRLDVIIVGAIAIGIESQALYWPRLLTAYWVAYAAAAVAVVAIAAVSYGVLRFAIAALCYSEHRRVFLILLGLTLVGLLAAISIIIDVWPGHLLRTQLNVSWRFPADNLIVAGGYPGAFYSLCLVVMLGAAMWRRFKKDIALIKAGFGFHHRAPESQGETTSSEVLKARVSSFESLFEHGSRR